VHGVRYAIHNEATSDLFQYIAVFYNRSRRHSTLGYLSPTILQNWIERQDPQEMAT
jgi:transposase InsO family protein